jgi:DNA-binding LacI/PurR family transcriptional regulator
VVGFDDIRFADFPEIGLTTVRQPNYEMGKLTADILLDCIVIATNSQTHCEIISPRNSESPFTFHSLTS